MYVIGVEGWATRSGPAGTEIEPVLL